MLLTEAEAKTKDCCVRNIPECVASDCMAWRWRVVPREEVPARDVVETDHTGLSRPTRAPRVPARIGRGYCGLVGKPEPEQDYF